MFAQIKCGFCNAKILSIDTDDEGWERIGFSWYCKEHAMLMSDRADSPFRVRDTSPHQSAAGAFADLVRFRGAVDDAHKAAAAAVELPNPPFIHDGHSLQDEFGFTEPEDGSEGRYHRRKQIIPWVHHTVWWIIHNAVAHPLIAFIPVRKTFQFHDWTSRKMHKKI